MEMVWIFAPELTFSSKVENRIACGSFGYKSFLTGDLGNEILFLRTLHHYLPLSSASLSAQFSGALGQFLNQTERDLRARGFCGDWKSSDPF
jgi:hypothetical protein